MIKKIMIGLMMLALIAIVGCSGSDTNNSVTGAAIEDSNFVGDDVVKIPLDDVTNTVKKYNYDANGVTITYFAVRGSDGKVRTAFDACDVCGGYKGYVQQGRDIKCNNCGRVFSIDGLGSKNKGYGCWPSYLSHTIEDGNVVIKTAEIEAGKSRFA
ncbi:MAG: DUF2318 domain-containing protein [Nanoarchaeota archaeon]|nr:DUF2318 domain-containing protein [Nanoarchaeota archaeon]